MSDSSTAIVQQMYAAFGRGDVPGLLAHVADDVEWTVIGPEGASPFFGTWRGRDGVGRFFQTVGAHLEFDRFEAGELIAGGDKVIVLGLDHARNKANGKRYQSDFVHVFTLRGGKVVAFREFLDTAAVAAAFG